MIDSVAKKHRTAHGKFGTQCLQINPWVNVDFEDRGGLMGFEILPIEDGDEGKYDVITITSPEQWVPSRFIGKTLTVINSNSCKKPEFFFFDHSDDLIQMGEFSKKNQLTLIKMFSMKPTKQLNHRFF